MCQQKFWQEKKQEEIFSHEVGMLENSDLQFVHVIYCDKIKRIFKTKVIVLNLFFNNKQNKISCKKESQF